MFDHPDTHNDHTTKDELPYHMQQSQPNDELPYHVQQSQIKDEKCLNSFVEITS